MTTQIDWQPDLLGPGFEAVQTQLENDSIGERFTTVVHHLPEVDPDAWPADERGAKIGKFAIVAVHGWNDYFYHRHFARFISSLGGSFFAVDLSRYGRSHRADQPWGYTDNLDNYADDLEFAFDVVRSEVGTDVPIILYGHSCGGLITTLWAHNHSELIAGLLTNAPFLDPGFTPAVRKTIDTLVSAMKLVNPLGVMQSSDSGFYQKTLLGGHLREFSFPDEEDPENDPFLTTGWEPDPRFRHFPSFPRRYGWLSAILNGHDRVAAGLDIKVPVLVITSTRWIGDEPWSEEYLRADCTVDLGAVWQRAANIGNDVTIRKIPNAVHDVLLSRASAREQVFDAMAKWLISTLG